MCNGFVYTYLLRSVNKLIDVNKPLKERKLSTTTTPENQIIVRYVVMYCGERI